MAVLALSLLGTVLAYLTFFAGLKRIGASNTAIVSTLEPIVGVLLALMVLGESLTPLKTVGGILIIAAVLLLVWKKPPPDTRAANMSCKR